MAFAGLDSILPSGTVTFTNDDALVHFPAALGPITMTASFTISLEGCHPALWGCAGTYTSHQPGKFPYTVPSSNFTIDAALSPDPQTNKPKFTVVDLDYSFASMPVMHIADDLPSWLDCLKYLDGWFVTQGAIKGALSANVTKSLKSAGLWSYSIDTPFRRTGRVSAALATPPPGEDRKARSVNTPVPACGQFCASASTSTSTSSVGRAS